MQIMNEPDSHPSGAAGPEAIAERIRAAILEHRLAPGAKLTEAQLCDVFGVKRGTIRQALAQLATDKLVDLEPNRGAFVASPTLQDVHEVFEMRRIIELAVVERLATAAAGEMEEVEEEQHSGAFRNSSPTGLAPAAFSMTAAEESTQGNLSTMQLASGGNDHACLDTAATSIAAAEEIGQVASVTTTEAAGNDSTEQGSLCCSEMTENSTAVGNPVNLIPISLDTVVVVISPATGETGIEGCMDAAELSNDDSDA